MKRVLLKISGELLSTNADQAIIQGVIKQIKKLLSTHHFGIVIGGGNFFRGGQQGVMMSLNRSTADTVGMLATVMNALILQDLCLQEDIDSVVLSSIAAPQVSSSISPHSITQAQRNNQLIIFAGGTGCPYVTTDTNAVIRALQVGASQLWKATKVDFVYDSDPTQHDNAQALKTLTYQEALDKKLGIMDATALTLAQENGIVTRIFNIFTQNALQNIARNSDVGSTISFT